MQIKEISVEEAKTKSTVGRHYDEIYRKLVNSGKALEITCEDLKDTNRFSVAIRTKLKRVGAMDKYVVSRKKFIIVIYPIEHQ